MCENWFYLTLLPTSYAVLQGRARAFLCEQKLPDVHGRDLDYYTPCSDERYQ